MKKLLFLGMLTAGLTAAAQSNSQVTTRTTHTTTTTHSHRYYYYPSSNVYFDSTSGDYYYYDAPETRTWMRVRTLPPDVTIDSTDRQVIYYNGDQVWKDNAAHIRKYKATRKGVKVKPVKD
jgi:hypothetical protein